MTKSLLNSIAGDGVSVLHPESDGYDRARSIWNGAVDARPAVIVQCRTAENVQSAVRAATEAGLAVAVRSGGHDWNGRSIREAGMVIDVSAMNAVSVDGDLAWFQGGATSSDVLRSVESFGGTVVTGTVGSVGLTGLILGGGYGPLTGRHGMAADNLQAAEVVLSDGTLVRTSEHERPDLLWALRGGGGNFGVVTRAAVTIHPIEKVYSGLVAFPLPEGRSVLRSWRAITDDAPPELGTSMGAMTVPGIGRVIYVSMVWSGNPDAGAPVFEEITSWAQPVLEQSGSVCMSEVVTSTDAFVPHGRSYEIGTRSLLRFGDDALDRFIGAAESMPSATDVLNVHHFHGAAATTDSRATAFAERRPHFLIEIIGAWDEGDGVASTKWVHDTTASLAGEALLGGYVNLLPSSAADRVEAAYGVNTARLKAIKMKYDPLNRFTGVGALS